jgi:hypothetical protein
MIGRREFITLLGGAAAAWPVAAGAQQLGGVQRIGVLMGYAESDTEAQAFVAAFREALQQLGWTDSRNIRIDTRWAAPANAESRQRLAAELVALKPAAILSHNTPTTSAYCNKRAPSPSFSLSFPIRSAAASSRTSRGPVGMSLASLFWSRQWRGSCWSC